VVNSNSHWQRKIKLKLNMFFRTTPKYSNLFKIIKGSVLTPKANVRPLHLFLKLNPLTSSLSTSTSSNLSSSVLACNSYSNIYKTHNCCHRYCNFRRFSHYPINDKFFGLNDEQIQVRSDRDTDSIIAIFSRFKLRL